MKERVLVPMVRRNRLLFNRVSFYLAKQSRDVIGGLIKDKVELSISLIHLVSFQQTETGSSQ